MPDNVSTQFKETSNVSVRADGAITGCRFVTPSGRTGGPGLSTDLENLFVVQQAGDGDPVFGVAKYDIADDESGGIHGQPGMIVPVDHVGASAGVEVQSDLNGKAIPLAAGSKAGLCVGLDASTGKAMIKIGG